MTENYIVGGVTREDFQHITPQEAKRRRLARQAADLAKRIKLRQSAASAGRLVGRGLGGLGQAGIGFLEGVGAEIPQPSAREVGKGAARGIKGAAKGAVEAATYLEPSHPDYWWRGLGLKRAGSARLPTRPRELIPTRGGYSQRPQYPLMAGSTPFLQTKKPRSNLPLELQQEIMTILKEDYPQVYENLYHEGISLSELIGTLRDHYPEIYNNLLTIAKELEYGGRGSILGGSETFGGGDEIVGLQDVYFE